MTSKHLDPVRQQLEVEYADLTTHLANIPEGDDLLGKLLRDQALDRASAIELELQGLDEEAFELAFAEKGSTSNHSLSTSVLTNLLSRFQHAITYAGWARMAGPGVHGQPPALIARLFETQVNAFKPGSFAVELSPYEASLEHEALEEALEDFLLLASLGASDSTLEPTEEVTELVHALGAEATKRFSLFFAKVHEAHLEARFEWQLRPEAGVALQPEEALALSAWLKDVDEDFETVTVMGTLTAADANDGLFAITDELGEIHDGKAAPELLSRAVIDGRYEAVMRVTTYRSTLTDMKRQRAVLESLTARE